MHILERIPWRRNHRSAEIFSLENLLGFAPTRCRRSIRYVAKGYACTTQKPLVGTSGNARQSSMSTSPMFCKKERKRAPEEALAPLWGYMGLLTNPLLKSISRFDDAEIRILCSNFLLRSADNRKPPPKARAVLCRASDYIFLFMSDAVFSRSSRAFFSCSVSI